MIKIALVFICRDNAGTIQRMIDSCLPVVDVIIATDTGSQDNTIELIQSYSNRLPVLVFEEPWKNFGYNRTIMMENAKEFNPECDYFLVMDTDETLEISNQWDKKKLSLDGYMVRTHSGDMFYYRERMLSAKFMWPWRGYAHECIVSPHGIRPFGIIDSLTMRVHPKDNIYSANIIRNRELLLKEYLGDPNNSRTVFYLGESSKDLRFLDDAIMYYELRTKMGGFKEEIYYSMLQLGIIHKWLEKIDVAKNWFYKAIETRERRVEAMYELALIHHQERRYDLACMYCERILNMPESEDSLFVNVQIKEYLAKFQLSLSLYWAKEYKKALKVCHELMDTNMPDNYKEQNLKNIAYTRRQINELFSEEKTLVISVPAAWDGLGDTLFLSHLPKIAKEKGGYQYVYINENHAYKSPGTQDLVWRSNPYVDGFTREGDLYFEEQQWVHWTLCGLGDIRPPREKFANNAMLHRLMKIYKLDDPDFDGLPYVNIGLIQEKCPDINIDFTVIQNSIIFDGNWKAHIGLEEADVLKFFETNRKPDLQFTPVNHSKSEVGGAESKCILIPDVPQIKVANIYEYAFILSNCKQFICLMSGGAVLSAALHKPCIVLDSKKTTAMHRFDEFNYHLYLDKVLIEQKEILKLYNKGNRIKFVTIYPKPISEKVSFNSLLSNDRLISIRNLLLSVADLEGAIMEIGCYKGGCARYMAEHTTERVYLVDTFDGLPEPTAYDNKHIAGEFRATMEDVEKTMEGIKDWTVIKTRYPAEDPMLPTKFKFVHLDVDLYESTIESLRYLESKMVKGGIIVIDDYESKDCLGVTRAVNEYIIQSRKVFYTNTKLQAHIIF